MLDTLAGSSPTLFMAAAAHSDISIAEIAAQNSVALFYLETEMLTTDDQWLKMKVQQAICQLNHLHRPKSCDRCLCLITYQRFGSCNMFHTFACVQPSFLLCRVIVKSPHGNNL